MGSTETSKITDTRSRRWNGILVFLVVGVAYVHANLHPTNLPSLILDFPIWLPDEPLGETTGATGWPFRYMYIDPEEATSFWSTPTFGGNMPLLNRIAFGFNVAFGMLAAYIASRRFLRAVMTEHGLGFVVASFLAMVATLTVLLRGSIPLWDDLADHLSVALIVASLFAIWETVFARAAIGFSKLAKGKGADRRRPSNAVEWYLAGQEYQHQQLSDTTRSQSAA